MGIPNGMMITPRGHIKVVSWDSFASGFVNLDVEITSPTFDQHIETWYNVPTQFVNEWLGLEINTTITNLNLGEHR